MNSFLANRFRSAPLFVGAFAALFALAPDPARAGSQYKILEVRGAVSLNGKEVVPGEVLSTGGEFQTGADGYVKFFVVTWDHTLALGKNSELEVNVRNLESLGNYRLKKGYLRWISGTAGKLASHNFHVSTPNALLGARGTNFFVIYNKEFGETELVVFEGKVEIATPKSQNDGRIVNAGFWSGIGGRFGEAIREPWKMNTLQVERFRRLALP